MLKPKLTALFTFLLLLGVVAGSGYYLQLSSTPAARDKEAKTTSAPPREQPSTSPRNRSGSNREAPPSVARSSPPQPTTKKAVTESVIRFSNNQSKQTFLMNNDLDADSLEPLAALENTYSVAIAPSELKLSPGSEVFPNLTYKAVVEPNDPRYDEQWHLPKISAPAAWNISTGSNDTVVAVIDTGFALGHLDMADRWANNSDEMGLTADGDVCWNGIPEDRTTNDCDDDSNGLVDDWRGWDFVDSDNEPQAGTTDPNGEAVEHGSLTSGAAAATGNNLIGVAGVDWQTRVLPLQALDDNGVGSTESIVEAIIYAADQGADVISLSLGGPDNDSLLRGVINGAVATGSLVVAAAGNCGNINFPTDQCDFRGQVLEPARYGPVLAVGATTTSDRRASFSSFGTTLDITAPGVLILSTSWTPAFPATAYQAANGTSLSAPLVSGLASLLLATNDSLSSAGIRNILTAYADRVPDMQGKTKALHFGYGRINAWVSLNVARGRLPIYTVYDAEGIDHIYTRHPDARDRMVKNQGFKYQGVGFWGVTSANPDAQPIYSLYDSKGKNHFYTRRLSTKNRLVQEGKYKYLGVGFWGLPSSHADAQPIYSLYDSKGKNHFYTRRLSTKNRLVQEGKYKYLGVGFWAQDPS